MKLKIMTAIMVVLCVICGICLFSVYSAHQIEGTTNYQIYVYPDGSATINVNNIGYVRQLQEDTPFGRFHYLKAGTLIIPSDGTEIQYEYPRRDTYTQED